MKKTTKFVEQILTYLGVFKHQGHLKVSISSRFFGSWASQVEPLMRKPHHQDDELHFS